MNIITMWHNEEYLAPLFLNHYAAVDQIIIILDDCTDGSRDHIAQSTAPCEVLEVKTGGLDDIMKAQILSDVLNIKNHMPRAVVDSDEFIYSVNDIPIAPGCVYSVGLWEVFRNEKDSDIDRALPPLQQRVYGNETCGQCFGQDHFVKPIIFGPGIIARLAPGNHSLVGPSEVIDGQFEGAHWAMADPELAIQRRLTKRARMSKVNYDNGLTSHDWNITEEVIRAECEQMKDSGKVVDTGYIRFNEK